MKMPFNTAETLRAWLLSALVVHGAVGGNPDAKRLYDDLLSNYNKLVRPVVNTSDVLKVCIKLKLSQLIDVVSILLHILLFGLSSAPFVLPISWLSSHLGINSMQISRQRHKVVGKLLSVYSRNNVQ